SGTRCTAWAVAETFPRRGSPAPSKAAAAGPRPPPSAPRPHWPPAPAAPAQDRAQWRQASRQPPETWWRSFPATPAAGARRRARPAGLVLLAGLVRGPEPRVVRVEIASLLRLECDLALAVGVGEIGDPVGTHALGELESLCPRRGLLYGAQRRGRR